MSRICILFGLGIASMGKRPCGRPPPSAKGGWMTRGIVDWNHGQELLKQPSGSKWHQDSSITVRMAKHVEQQNVIDAMCRCC